MGDGVWGVPLNVNDASMEGLGNRPKGVTIVIGEVLGHYRVVAKIGEGGMGVVYRAHDEVLLRDVALKVVAAGSVADKSSRDFLLHEARAASALSHPNVCTVYEVGEVNGELYIVMEWVEGKPLGALIGSAGLPVESVLRYGMQIASALAHSHGREIVHRDLKSSNVVVTPEGLVKVLDFGLARRLKSEVHNVVTQSAAPFESAGGATGTLPYMAPEVLRGEEGDHRSDLWALGVMLYEAASGRLPFQGRTTFEMSSAILREPPAPLPSSIPPGLWAIIQRCLAKEPAQRYQRASEVHAALEAVHSASVTAAAQPAEQTGVDQIQPLPNSPFSPDEHNAVGTIPVAKLPDRPGYVARVKARGFRQGQRVVRKADVVTFKPRSRRAWAISAAILLACGLAFFAWLWRSKGVTVTPNRENISKQSGKVETGSEKQSPQDRGGNAATGGESVKEQPVRIVRFTVEPSQVRTGQAVTLRWDVVNATGVRITPGPGNLAPSGTAQFFPSPATTLLELQAEGAGAGNSASAQRPIQILPASPPAIDFTADFGQITIGQSVRLHWSVTDATKVRIDPGFALLSPRGETKVSPEGNTEYTLTAQGPGGTASRSFAVRVAPKIASFEAVPPAIERCQIAILRWTVHGASSISVEPGIGLVSLSDYKVVRPLETTRYILKADSPGGSQVRSATVSVAPGTGTACGPL
jgi:serine/threonine protein kinase